MELCELCEKKPAATYRVRKAYFKAWMPTKYRLDIVEFNVCKVHLSPAVSSLMNRDPDDVGYVKVTTINDE